MGAKLSVASRASSSSSPSTRVVGQVGGGSVSVFDAKTAQASSIFIYILNHISTRIAWKSVRKQPDLRTLWVRPGGRGHSPRPRAFRGSTGVLQAARSRPQSPRSGHPESKLGAVCGAAFTALNPKARFWNSGPIPVIEPDLVTNASTLDPFLTSKRPSAQNPMRSHYPGPLC